MYGCTWCCTDSQCGNNCCGGTCGTCPGCQVCNSKTCVESDLGIEWVHIPIGLFDMGSASGDIDEQPIHPTHVFPFAMSKSEVTVEQYHLCVEKSSCSRPSNEADCAYWIEGQDQHPVDCVTWEQADEFCSCISARLPSEAEWEYAARSGGANIAYPWGSTPATCQRAVMFEAGPGCGSGGTEPVCSKPDGHTVQGLCDMAGNAAEWVQDWYHDSYIDAPEDGSAWEDPPGQSRVIRGGGFYDQPGGLRTTRRNLMRPSTAERGVGFRCVRVSD